LYLSLSLSRRAFLSIVCLFLPFLFSFYIPLFYRQANTRQKSGQVPTSEDT
jgi:hypothetical protein